VTTEGYYRFPTIHQDTIVFVCEDDLWSISTGGGIARRLTANLGVTTHPAISPDGNWLAFIGRDEGAAEVYVMPAAGGEATRLTYLGANTRVLGWTPEGDIVFASNSAQPFRVMTLLYKINPQSRASEPLPYGPARSISFGPDGGVVIGRRSQELAYWKRYRGGTSGDLWIDIKGNGKFKNLLKLKSNLINPMWLRDRVFFLSDHEGIGNLYSCTTRGTRIQRHTSLEDYYVRDPATDGRRIVYRTGADLYLLDPAKEGEKSHQKIDIDLHSPRTQRSRKFVGTASYLESVELHPDGHSLAATVRGKPFTFSNWEGAVLRHGQPHGVRYRLPTWLNDGSSLLVVNDEAGEEAFTIFPGTEPIAPDAAPVRFDELDIGRPLNVTVSPHADLVVFSNHRFELMLLNLEEKSLRLLDKSDYGRIIGTDWSPDGKWVAYGFRTSQHTAAIKLCHIETGETHFVTSPRNLFDIGPSFDPQGKYLYFISYRDFDPVYDSVYFDLNFPRGSRPYLVTLQKETPTPFIPHPNHTPDNNNNGNNQATNNSKDQDSDEKSGKEANENDNEGQDTTPAITIDLDDIQQRVVAFPVAEGKYARIRGIKGKVLFTLFPVAGSLDQDWVSSEKTIGKGSLQVYDLAERKLEIIAGKVNDFEVSRKRSHLVYRSGKNLRVLKAGDKPDSNASGFSRKSGWIQLTRIRTAIVPQSEWQQMFREAWRLQRDHFWTEDMSQVDWQKVYQRYYPLIERVASRAEFSDLLWEMQGELGTSHAYELGGDYRATAKYDQGFLGADFEYDAEQAGYRVTHIVQGDSWLERFDSPLNRPGVNIRPGDLLVAIDGQRLSPELSPAQLLVNRARQEVQLSVLPGTPPNEPSGDSEAEAAPALRNVVVKAAAAEQRARYREWVELNRQTVHNATDGRVGYVHIPDMGPIGYAEFHRYYLAESERDGLIVDVRFNGGGHVSQLIVEKLARRRVGYDQPRYGKPEPYPDHSVLGPIVAITNEFAGSDGDIFSHVFKLLKLGPLIGKRTWGGVIGIWPRHSLVDGTITTQPEFSFWFEDVGWSVENYGTDPDIEVDIKPQDYAKGRDTQLERAVAEVQRLLAENPPVIPQFDNRPSLTLPQLPKVKKRNS
jgi:tricorn protease